MKIVKSSLILLVFAFQTTAYSQVVVGPSSGFVIGPYGETLENIVVNYNLKDQSEEDESIQKNIYALDNADGKLSCKYDLAVAKEMSLKTGADRLSLLQTSVSMLDNPKRAKALLDPDQSESVNMITASETLGASSLTFNESDSSKRSDAYVRLCSKLNNSSKTKLGIKTAGEQNQLNAYFCMSYQIMSHLTSLFADSDVLFQKATEVNAIVNKAMAEETTRTASVQVQENKIKAVNSELKAALEKLKKSKEEHKKASEALKVASDALAALNEKSKDQNSDKDKAALEEAQAAVALAQQKVNKAQEEVDKAGKELLVFLKTKMVEEARTILALLSGTIYGDANGTDVHFKVSDKEFTLVNTDDALSTMFGIKPQEPHWGRFQLENPTGTQADFLAINEKFYVDTYFSKAADHLTAAKTDPADKKYYMLNGGEISREQAQLATARPAESDKATAAILDKFYGMGSNGASNIETIAMALADYQSNTTEKQLGNLEAMKTPESRMKYSAQVLDKTNELNQNIRVMIVNNICYLDSMLNIFKKTHDMTTNTTANKKVPFLASEQHLQYLYNLKTKSYKKKLNEGYKSKVNIQVILKDLDAAITRSLLVESSTEAN